MSKRNKMKMSERHMHMREMKTVNNDIKLSAIITSDELARVLKCLQANHIITTEERERYFLEGLIAIK